MVKVEDVFLVMDFSDEEPFTFGKSRLASCLFLFPSLASLINLYILYCPPLKLIIVNLYGTHSITSGFKPEILPMPSKFILTIFLVGTLLSVVARHKSSPYVKRQMPTQ